VGFINPPIYTIGAGASYNNEFNDVITGNNDCCGQQAWYDATATYDLVTGWGSPNGQNLIDSLAGPLTGPAFALAANPSRIVAYLGATSTSAIYVNALGGFTGSVNLSVSGVPNGVTASWSTNPTAGSSVLTLTADTSGPTGVYPLTITGTSGTLTATTTLFLTVYAPGFSIAPLSSTMTVSPSSPGSDTIVVTDLGDFSGIVTLTIGRLPDGVTASLSQNPTIGNSVLTLSATDSATTGTSTIFIAGTSPGAFNSIMTIVLTVNPAITTAPAGYALSNANFGSTNIGATSSSIPLVFTFNAAATIGRTVVLTQGAAGLDFADAGASTCAANTIIALGGSCTENITFTPKSSGARNGAVVLEDSDGNVLATGYVQGIGVGPQINFLPNTESVIASLYSGLMNPYSVAVDGSGNVYIADSGNHRILKETLSEGGYIESTVPTSSLNIPYDVAVDGFGNVYVADPYNHRVLKETPAPDGGYSENIVADFSSREQQPFGVAVDGNGNVYIAVPGWFDSSNNFVPAILYEETLSMGVYAESVIPTPGIIDFFTIAVDGNGNIYIAENDANIWPHPENSSERILKETFSAGFYTQSVLPTSGLGTPNGIAVDANGNVFISDYTNYTVLKETMLAGNYTQSTLLTSPLGPAGVAVDGSGNVYIADALNWRILKENFVDPPSLSFADAAVNSTSGDSPQTVTVENVGNAALRFPIPSSGSNPSISTNFTLNSIGDSACPLVSDGSSMAGTLAAGTSCQLPISFTPTAMGALSGSLVLTDNNLNFAAPGYASQSITLSGTGTQITPTITWATPAAITYGTPLSRRQLNARSTVAGTFAYSPAAGTVLGAGQQTLTVIFSPTDTTNYTTATATVTFTVNQSTPLVIWATPAAITYGTALSGIQLNAKSTVAGNFTYSPASGAVLNAGTQKLTATFAPTNSTDYSAATASVQLTVNKAKLTITWATPAAVSYGTALNGMQLDATSAADGTFTYSPAAGTMLGAGSHTLTVTFKPAIASNYTTASATATVTLAVNKAIPTMTWAAPKAVTYGTALSATQLNASSPVAGKFTYTPATGTVLTVGTHTLSVTFAPTDTTDYNTVTVTVTLTVNKATPTVKLTSSASSIAYDKSLKLTTTVTGGGVIPTGPVSFFDGATQLSTSALNASGVATYSTSKLAVGKHSITTSYSGDGNYIAATSASVSVTVTAK
jgi:hypothetical protein